MKITQSNIIGMHVVLNDNPDAQVYQVLAKHESLPVYAVAYFTAKGVTPSYWIDIRVMQPATPKQIAEYEKQVDRIFAGENFVS
jgi:hypothetical protein